MGEEEEFLKLEESKVVGCVFVPAKKRMKENEHTHTLSPRAHTLSIFLSHTRTRTHAHAHTYGNDVFNSNAKVDFRLKRS